MSWFQVRCVKSVVILKTGYFENGGLISSLTNLLFLYGRMMVFTQLHKTALKALIKEACMCEVSLLLWHCHLISTGVQRLSEVSAKFLCKCK